MTLNAFMSIQSLPMHLERYSASYLPVFSIGGASFDGSAFGIAPDLEVDTVAERIRECLSAIKESV